MQFSKIIFGLILSFILFALFACEEATDWDLEPGENGRLVVDAILTDEMAVQEIRLSLSYDELNGTAPSITDANVSVQVNGLSYSFVADQADPGLYKSAAPFEVLNSLDYQLTIEWQGQSYEADSRLPVVFPIPEISFQRRADSTLTFDEVPFLYNNNQQAMYEMKIDWSHLSNDSITGAKIVFFTFSSLDESELIRPDRETVIFPIGSKVFLTKYGLSDDFAEYLRALAIEIYWDGGAFYSASSSLPTNISGNGLGYFSTCAVLRDTMIAE